MTISGKIERIPDWVLIPLLLAFALAMRLLYLYLHPLIARDGISYFVQIQEWFEQGDSYFSTYTRIQPPLFCYLSRALMFTGFSAETAAKCVNMTAGTLLIIPVYFSGKVLFQEKIAAIWLALLACVMTPLVKYSCELTRESLYFLFLFSVIACWLGAVKGCYARRNVFFCAFLATLSLLCRYESGELLPFCFATLFFQALFPGWKWRHAGKKVLVFAVGVFAGAAVIALLPGLPNILLIFSHRVWMQCVGTFINPL